MTDARIRPLAVIFDYGNVLCGPQDRAEVEAMAALLHLPVEQFHASYWKSRLDYDKAALDATAYWNGIAGRRLTPAEIATLSEIDSESWTHPDPVMPLWARRLRAAGMRTALLSNMPVPVRDYVQRCDWLPEFDQCTFSCDLRSAKPAREIYEHCLRGLGVAPSEALLLDDRPENARAAEDLGIHAVVFTTPIEAASMLHHRFDLPVSLVATVPALTLGVATVDKGDEKNK